MKDENGNMIFKTGIKVYSRESLEGTHGIAEWLIIDINQDNSLKCLLLARMPEYCCTFEVNKSYRVELDSILDPEDNTDKGYIISVSQAVGVRPKIILSLIKYPEIDKGYKLSPEEVAAFMESSVNEWKGRFPNGITY